MKAILDEIRLLAERWPWFYVLLLRICYKGKKFEKHIISERTSIVVEGFPRSGNSFAAQAIRLITRRHGKQWRFATHFHSPAHVVYALRYRKPILVVIRRPVDAIVSLRALWGQNNVRVPSVNHLLRRYIQFYEMLLVVRKSIIVADFDTVISDLNKVIHRLNCRFHIDIPENYSQAEIEGMVMPTSGEHLGPSDRRDEVKVRERKLFFETAKPKLLEQANEVYTTFTN